MKGINQPPNSFREFGHEFEACQRIGHTFVEGHIFMNKHVKAQHACTMHTLAGVH